jgi:DNA primase
MYQAGVQNVVSSSGTSLTKEQIKLIRRYTHNITILYDGDAAGIKASFRGIDLILEEGMNVKVVLFPEGEDPDSYSKSVSTTELEQYIAQHTQDFISFKASILLNQGEATDPIKRAELIREIVHSVALIPDQITRTVYLQQIAKQFDISEQIVSNELIKLRKQAVSKQLQEPEIAALPFEKQLEPAPQTSEKTREEENLNAESELIRILIKYGTRVLTTHQLDEHGKSSEVETSVIELIHHELDKDELNFSHALHAKIYALFIEAMHEKQLLESSYLKRLEDQEVVRFVSNIESSDHELSSKWYSNYRIQTRSESDRMNETVMNAVYSFKASKIESEISAIRMQLEHAADLSEEELTELLSQQIVYERIKIILAEKLGRIILR